MRTPTLATLALLIGTGVIAACTTEETKTADPKTNGTDGGTPAAVTCKSTSGNGTIDLTVTGLPPNAKFDPSSQIVHFKGTADSGGSQTGLLASSAGIYSSSSADIIFTDDPIVRTAYSATISPSSFCVEDQGSTKVVVTYAPIPSSNKLWTTNNSPSGQVLGFGSSVLGATGTPPATVAIKSPAGRSIAFDAEGNMWTLQGTVGDAPIQRYAASTLGASGDKTPDRSLTLDAGCVPGLTELAFSPTGELYVSSACGQKISRLAVADIAASGSPVPNMTLGGLNAPEGMAFDTQGNLWVADSGAKTILKYNADRLATASTAPADLTITPQTSALGDLAPNHLAFDAGGGLWATSFGGNIVYRLNAADMSGTGPKTLTPTTLLTLPVDELLEGIAFDEGGQMWLTLSTGKIGRLSGAQLGTSTTAGSPTIPEIIVTSPDLGNAVSLAFYPPASNGALFGR